MTRYKIYQEEEEEKQLKLEKKGGGHLYHQPDKSRAFDASVGPQISYFSTFPFSFSIVKWSDTTKLGLEGNGQTKGNKQASRRRAGEVFCSFLNAYKQIIKTHHQATLLNSFVFDLWLRF